MRRHAPHPQCSWRIIELPSSDCRPVSSITRAPRHARRSGQPPGLPCQLLTMRGLSSHAASPTAGILKCTTWVQGGGLQDHSDQLQPGTGSAACMACWLCCALEITNVSCMKACSILRPCLSLHSGDNHDGPGNSRQDIHWTHDAGGGGRDHRKGEDKAGGVGTAGCASITGRRDHIVWLWCRSARTLCCLPWAGRQP